MERGNLPPAKRRMETNTYTNTVSRRLFQALFIYVDDYVGLKKEGTNTCPKQLPPWRR